MIFSKIGLSLVQSFFWPCFNDYILNTGTLIKIFWLYIQICLLLIGHYHICNNLSNVFTQACLYKQKKFRFLFDNKSFYIKTHFETLFHLFHGHLEAGLTWISPNLPRFMVSYKFDSKWARRCQRSSHQYFKRQ